MPWSLLSVQETAVARESVCQTVHALALQDSTELHANEHSEHVQPATTALPTEFVMMECANATKDSVDPTAAKPATLAVSATLDAMPTRVTECA